jgi:hypothetical protein
VRDLTTTVLDAVGVLAAAAGLGFGAAAGVLVSRQLAAVGAALVVAGLAVIVGSLLASRPEPARAGGGER